MTGQPRPRLAAVLLLVVLLAPTIPIPSGSADQAPATFRPLPGLEGPRATLRLYGCTDDLAESPVGTVATRLRGDEDAAGTPDGRLDCAGDRLHLGDAFLASAADPAHRNALGPRDQTVRLSVRHLPTAWFPGPSHPGGVSDPVDPSRGLFDVDDDAVLDPLPPAGAAAGADGPAPIDSAPRDGRPDIALRAVGDESDLYFPALEARYDLAWTAGTNDPVPLPARSSFLFPTHAPGAAPGLHDWSTPGAAAPVQWHPRPFASGTHNDQRGALHTQDMTLEEGAVVWFLDHGLRITGFFGTADAPRVAVEVLYNGGGTEEVLERSVILVPGDDGDTHATLDRSSSDPGNIVFADRTGIDRDIPPFHDPDDPASDALWFALLSSATIRPDSAPSAQIRLGRIVGEQAPASAFVADRVLYRIATLDERDGALHSFGLAALHPLDVPAEMPAVALTLAGWKSDAALPVLPPFDRAHVTLGDLRPNLQRTDGGFLSGSGHPIGASGLTLRQDARTPAERARPADPVTLQWRSTGQESRFLAPLVDVRTDARLTVSALLPVRYVEVVLPDGTYRVDSVLLDDTQVLGGAGVETATPRAHRSFLFDPQDPTPLFGDDQGLRMASGTIDRPTAGDLVRFDPAILHWNAYGGRIRTPDRLADQAVRLSLTYEAYAAFGAASRPAPQTGANDTALQDGARGVHDNLWDADTTSDGPENAFAPALRTTYTHLFLDRATLDGYAPALGMRTALILPATDRSTDHPGLDSFDMLGDGQPDETLLRGYWDMSRSGTARDRLTTGGTYVEGNASTSDLLWLQSRAFALAPGAALQFFDHGVRFEGATSVDGTVVPRLTLLDHQAAGAPTALATIDDARVEGAACLAVQWNGAARQSAAPCAGLEMAPPEPNLSPRAHDVMWWMELQAVSEEAATVVLNRLVTDVDRDPPGDQRRMLAGGQVYSWDDVRIERDRIEALVLSHLTPLGEGVRVPRETGSAVSVTALRADAPLPLLPPFRAPYTALQIHDMAVEWGAHGLLDSRAQPDDKDAVTIARPERVYQADPLSIRYRALDMEARHSFVFLDPTRAWDPSRAGTAFVNGIWAEPWAGLSTWDGPQAALATLGAEAFDEALRAHGDRGWSHRARVVIEGPASVLVDSGRLAHPDHVARLADLGIGATGGASGSGPAPSDPLLIAEGPRGSGLWTLRLHRPTDLYIGVLEAPVRPPPTDDLPSPTPVPDRSPATPAPWPSQPQPSDTPRDSPLGLGAALIAVLAALLWVRRRR